MATVPAAQRTRQMGRWWLVIVGVPTGYLVVGLIGLCIEGIVNVGGADGGTTATLVLLGLAPLVVWVVAYAATRRSLPRSSCAALYATALTFPVALCALIARLAMNAPFF